MIMANTHHAHRLTRDDYDRPWKVPAFKNPAVKSTIGKCDVCSNSSRRKPLTRQQFKKLYR